MLNIIKAYKNQINGVIISKKIISKLENIETHYGMIATFCINIIMIVDICKIKRYNNLFSFY
jgi:hypothetical protein